MVIWYTSVVAMVIIANFSWKQNRVQYVVGFESATGTVTAKKTLIHFLKKYLENQIHDQVILHWLYVCVCVVVMVILL